MARNAEFLVAHELESGDLVLFVTGLSLAGAFAALLLDRILELVWKRLAQGLHALLWTLLTGIFALQASKGIAGVPGIALVLVSLVLGAFVAWSVLRFTSARWFLLGLSPCIFLFPALFVFRPPVSGLFFPESPRLAGGPAVVPTTPVVLVVFDELPLSTLLDRGRQINAHRYPSFARLARRSTWFRNATAVAEGTTYAVPAIVTGRYPDRERLARASAYPDNLFTWLGTSYRMNVLESHTKLCPAELCGRPIGESSSGEKLKATFTDLCAVYLHLVLPVDLTGRLPMVTGTWKDFWAPETGSPSSPQDSLSTTARGDVPRYARKFTESIHADGRGVLHYLHLMIPHIPWHYLPSGREYGPTHASLWPHGMGGRSWADDEWATIQGFQRHVLQTRYADTVLGEILDKLEAAGLYERSLLIVTADHGASFRPGVLRRGLDDGNVSDVMEIPLLVKVPFQAQGELSDRNVETVDIVPTIADVLGSELPWTADGTSLLGPSPAPRTGKTLVVWDERGEPVRQVFGERWEGGDETLERKLALFGSGEDPDSLYRIGRFGALVGRAAADLVGLVDSPVQVELDDAHRLLDVDPRSSFVPAHLTGRIHFGPRAGEIVDLAVAVNGTVRAVTRTFHSRRDEWEFTAMVKETSLRPGTNQVDVFEITGSPAEPRLVPLARKEAVTYRLTDGTRRLLASDGRSFEIQAQRIQGVVRNAGTCFKGWAADVEASRPADRILFFAGRDFVTAAPVGDWSPDIARRFQARSLLHSGFTLVIPYSLIRDRDESELRFFAVAGDLASPLAFYSPVPSKGGPNYPGR